MRILIINYEFPPIGGGGSIVTHYLAKNYAKFGHQVRVVTSQFADLLAEETIDGVQVHRVPVLRKSADVCQIHEMLTYTISASVHCLRLCTLFKPHVVHVFFGIPSGPVAYLLKKIFGIPYVLFLGGRDVPRKNPDPPYYRLFYGLLAPAIRMIWRNASAVVACSNGLRKLALETDSRAKIRVIPDGIDLSKFVSVKRKARPDFVRVLAIGRLIPRKGFQFLIEALPEIAQSVNCDFELEIVGDGPMKAQLIDLAKSMSSSAVKESNVDHKINFVGSVPYEKLVGHYNEADIFVLPSLAEGMPLVVLEAMATGLPIVASKVQGIEDLVQSGINGYLIEAGNTKQLAKNIAKLINDGQTRIEMGHKNVKRVRKYSWENIAHEYLELFERVKRKT